MPAIRARGGNIGGYQVYAKVKGRFRAVDPRMINWHTVDMRTIQIKQPPGERNALGQVKFMFPNPYAVYLHDTPSKSLFERDQRAFSHGCMRVMEPWSFADVLLSEQPDWNAARLKKLVGGPERRVDLSKHIPVHITYFTASVGADGELRPQRRPLRIRRANRVGPESLRFGAGNLAASRPADLVANRPRKCHDLPARVWDETRDGVGLVHFPFW